MRLTPQIVYKNWTHSALVPHQTPPFVSSLSSFLKPVHHSFSASVAFSSIFNMRFSTILAVLAAGATAFAAVIPNTVTPNNVNPTTDNSNNVDPNNNSDPKTVTKGSNTDFQSSFTSLGSQCTPIIQKFDTCSDDSCTTEIVDELVAAINTCKSGAGGSSGNNADSGLANAISGVVNVSGSKLLGPRSTHTPFQQIASGLEDHKNKCGGGCPNILTAYGQVDSSLSDCLSAYFNVSQGLAGLVSPL